VSIEILRDIPTIPDGPGLLQYKPVLDLILHSNKIKNIAEINPESTYDTRIKTQKRKDINDKINEKILHEKNTLKNSKDLSESDNYSNNIHIKIPTPVMNIIDVLRKSLNKFILNINDLKEAWGIMLNIFRYICIYIYIYVWTCVGI
jgi:hypothetical protein